MSGNLKLNTALGGSVALTPENTASNITVTVPATAGTMATSESTLAQFNASGSAPVYACRAWVNFNGTGTVAIRASGNVSSITDNGTGDYTVNFTTAMPDANYSIMGTSENVSPYNYPQAISPNRDVAPTTTALRIYTGYTGSQASLGGVLDSARVSVAIFR
jgi:hypothetical protein